jgi:hypothetical protein
MVYCANKYIQWCITTVFIIIVVSPTVISIHRISIIEQYQLHKIREAAKHASVNCVYIFQNFLSLRTIDVLVSPFDRLLYDRVSSDTV